MRIYKKITEIHDTEEKHFESREEADAYINEFFGDREETTARMKEFFEKNDVHEQFVKKSKEGYISRLLHRIGQTKIWKKYGGIVILILIFCGVPLLNSIHHFFYYTQPLEVGEYEVFYVEERKGKRDSDTGIRRDYYIVTVEYTINGNYYKGDFRVSEGFGASLRNAYIFDQSSETDEEEMLGTLYYNKNNPDDISNFRLGISMTLGE